MAEYVYFPFSLSTFQKLFSLEWKSWITTWSFDRSGFCAVQSSAVQCVRLMPPVQVRTDGAYMTLQPAGATSAPPLSSLAAKRLTDIQWRRRQRSSMQRERAQQMLWQPGGRQLHPSRTQVPLTETHREVQIAASTQRARRAAGNPVRGLEVGDHCINTSDTCGAKSARKDTVSEMKRGGGAEPPGKSGHNRVNVNSDGNTLQHSLTAQDGD